MFNKRKEDELGPQENTPQSPISARPAAAEAAPRTVPPVTGPGHVARRSVEVPHGSSRRAGSDRVMESGERKLIVGKGLSLSGEITACDILVVEGKVEAKLADGKLLEITESGQFKGNVEIENADIAGRYEGQLVVHGRLTIRGTGRISGVIKYGELEVNAGGQIIGELQVAGGGNTASSGNPSFKTAAKFTSAPDEDEETLLSRRAVNS